jgi:hypothetical protein
MTIVHPHLHQRRQLAVVIQLDGHFALVKRIHHPRAANRHACLRVACQQRTGKTDSNCYSTQLHHIHLLKNNLEN